MVRRTLVALAAVTAMLVPILVSASPAHAAASDTYVALGDSFTAGPLIPTQVSPYGCLKSNKNYPNVVRASLAPGVFRDVSCSGAETGDITGSQNVWPEGDLPPQVNAVTATTTIVTLGIGGNDIGFSGIIEDCATYNPFSTPCKDTYIVNGVDEISRRITETAPKVATVLSAIRARSAGARIFVVGYPQILPDSGSGCWPSMPIGFGDVPYLRAKTKELNTMLRTRAQAAGATFVDTYAPSNGKSACASSSTRWVEPIVPSNDAAPVHPNARGMTGMGGVVRTAIG